MTVRVDQIGISVITEGAEAGVCLYLYDRLVTPVDDESTMDDDTRRALEERLAWKGDYVCTGMAPTPEDDEHPRN